MQNLTWRCLLWTEVPLVTPASPDDSARPLLGAHCVALCMTMGAHGNDHEPEPPRAWVSASAFCKQGHVHQSGFPHLVIADIRTVQGLSSNNKPLSFTKELKQVLGCLPAIVPFPAAHLTSSRPNLSCLMKRASPGTLRHSGRTAWPPSAARPAAERPSLRPSVQRGTPELPDFLCQLAGTLTGLRSRAAVHPPPRPFPI